MHTGDKVRRRINTTSGLIATSGNTDAATTISLPFYEGIVVDVILDHKHPWYSESDGYNIGTVKVRIPALDNGKTDDLLSWAAPFDSTILELPLMGELVLIQKILGEFYYSRKLYLVRKLQENSTLNANDLLNNRFSKVDKSITSTLKEITKNKPTLGKYFKPDSRVRQLKPFEGDVILQGRMGHSIRFGSSRIDPGSKGMAPNIILRTGQGKDLEKDYSTKDGPFGLTLEDINKDASSIWMVSDQTVPFQPTTISAGSFYRSIGMSVQKFDKAQIFANSDRIILNSKKTHIMLFSNEEIYLNSFNGISADTDGSINLTANLDINCLSSRNLNTTVDLDVNLKAGSDIALIATEKISLVGKKIHIGGIQNDAEPLVGGTSLSIFLARLIQAIMGLGVTPSQIPTYQSVGSPVPVVSIPPTIVPGPSTFNHVITPTGPGILAPQIVTALTLLYNELVFSNIGSLTPLPFSGAPFNSNDVFVSMVSQDSTLAVVKNDFDFGTQVKTENNEWNLHESYYTLSDTPKNTTQNTGPSTVVPLPVELPMIAPTPQIIPKPTPEPTPTPTPKIPTGDFYATTKMVMGQYGPWVIKYKNTELFTDRTYSNRSPDVFRGGKEEIQQFFSLKICERAASLLQNNATDDWLSNPKIRSGCAERINGNINAFSIGSSNIIVEE